MKAVAEAERWSGTFSPDEPIIGGREIREPSIPLPTFGDDSVRVWNLNALGRPANQSAAWGHIAFSDLEGSWLHYAKEIAMILLNPDHPTLIRAHVFVEMKAMQPSTVKQHVSAIVLLRELALQHGFPANLSWWRTEDFVEAVAYLRADGQAGEHKLRYVVKIARLLHTCHSVLSEGGLPRNPWADPLSNPIRGDFKRGPLKTDPVHPDVYFPLLQAAWAYVSVFSKDILAASARVAPAPELPVARRTRFGPWFEEFERFVADPNALVPVREIPTDPNQWPKAINWSELHRKLGSPFAQMFLPRTPSGQRRRNQITKLAEAGRVTIGGTYTPTQSLPGRTLPWSAGFDLTQLGNEKRMLREACYIVITALTMMRDSEVQEIRRGSITTYQGVAALKSPLIKMQADRPLMYWWISDPVKEAIEVLESLSPHPTHLFSTSRVSKHASRGSVDQGGFLAPKAIHRFRRKINATSDRTGLLAIPEGDVTPHMLRRTIALITEYEHGGQVAASLQLKHAQRLSTQNALTGQYTAGSETWARELGERQARVAARRAIDSLATAPSGRGEPRGPGAQHVTRALNPPAMGAQVANDQTKIRLLAEAFPDMKYGSANVCLGIKAVAACLSAEERSSGVPVRPSVCAPSECGSSVLMPEHVLLWEMEEATLMSLRKIRKLSPLSRAQLDNELETTRRGLRTSHGKGRSV